MDKGKPKGKSKKETSGGVPLEVVRKIIGDKVVEHDHPMTEEAYQYFTTGDKERRKWPPRMDWPQYRVEDIHKILVELGDKAPLTLAELKLLVYEEPTATCVACVALKSEKAEFVPVAAVRIRNLTDAEVLKEVKDGSGPKADESVYGRLARFIETFEDTDGVRRPIIDGSYLPSLTKDGWARDAYCGPRFWFDKRTGETLPNFGSHLVLAQKTIQDRLGGNLPNTFSSVSVEWVIARREANYKAAIAERGQRHEQFRAKQAETAESLSDYLESRMPDRRGKRNFQRGR